MIVARMGLLALLACVRPEPPTRHVLVTDWDPHSHVLRLCKLPEGAPLSWVGEGEGPERIDGLVGRAVTEDGRSWRVEDCADLRRVLSEPPPAPESDTMVALAELDFADDPARVDALSQRTSELSDPERLQDYAWELAGDPSTAGAAVRFARTGLRLEQAREQPDVGLIVDLEVQLARALWTLGEPDTRREAVEQRRVTVARGVHPGAWQELNGWEASLELPQTPFPGAFLGPDTPYDPVAVDQELQALRGGLDAGYGRWSDALDEALGHVALDMSDLTDRASVCERVKEALARAQDRHLSALCLGDEDWMPGVRPLVASLVASEASTALPAPGEVQPGVVYGVDQLHSDGSVARGAVVFREGEAALADVASSWTREVRADEPSTFVLRVPSLVPSDIGPLADFVATAEEARGHDVIVLDLRGDGGGSYGPAYGWLGALSDRRLALASSVRRRRGTWRTAIGQGLEGRGESWSSSLYILVDGGTASSAEVFAIVARQLPGARIVGVPTRGAVLGSGGRYVVHPHLDLAVMYGSTWFAWDEVHPLAEGVGVFPDLWFVGEDPVQAVRRHARGR